MSDNHREEVRAARVAAAEKYRPEHIDLLVVAEAPPDADDRYFYFENVASDDWLFRGVCEVLLGATPSRTGKAALLAELQDRGMFLIDLKPDPVDGSSLDDYVPELISRCKELDPSKIVLVKATVYDAAFAPLRQAGLPVVDQRVYFPSTGRQADFRRQFAAAIGEQPPQNAHPATGSIVKPSRNARSERRSTFSRDEAARIRSLLDEIRRVDRPRQKRLRGELRASGFYITDYDQSNEGFTSADFDALIGRGTILVTDAQ